MRMAKPASQLFTVTVGEGLKTIDYLYRRLLEDSGTQVHTRNKIADEIGVSKPSLAHTIMILSRHGVITTRKGSTGGIQISMEQLQKHTVLDVIYYLGQDVPDPVGDDLFSRVKSRVFDLLNVPLIDFLRN